MLCCVHTTSHSCVTGYTEILNLKKISWKEEAKYPLAIWRKVMQVFLFKILNSVLWEYCAHGTNFILIYLNTYKGLAKTSSSFHCSRLIFDNLVWVITVRPSPRTYTGSHYMFSRLMETFCRYVLQMEVHQDVPTQTMHSSGGLVNINKKSRHAKKRLVIGQTTIYLQNK